MPKSNEGSVLVQSAVGPPIGVVEVEEDFVPNDEGIIRGIAKGSSASNQLPPAEADVVTGFQPPLFKSAAVKHLPVSSRWRRRPLLPKSVFIEIISKHRCRFNPSISAPKRLLIVDRVTQSRPDDALVKPAGIVAQAIVCIEPPPQGLVIVERFEFAISQSGKPESGVIKSLSVTDVGDAQQQVNKCDGEGSEHGQPRIRILDYSQRTLASNSASPSLLLGNRLDGLWKSSKDG